MHVWKTLKLFISSTFRDLELERDTLAKIFHDMQQQLLSRHLSLIPYDLRWRQKHSETSIVRWCIEMVQQCQYFVGILGDRYGWRPTENAYGNHNEQRLSVTEMEIEEALRSIEKNRRFFCFVATTEKSKENEEDRVALENLKQKLKRQGEKVYEFKNSQDMLVCIQENLQMIIDNDYPPGQIVANKSFSRRENTKEIIEQKLKGFVGRIKYLQKITEFVEQQNSLNYLIIHAMAGIGKSSVLAKFINDWGNNSTKIPILQHFMTMGSNSRELREIIANVAEQMKEHDLITEDLALDPLELKRQVRDVLENSEQKFILVIDAIDEVEEGAKSLTWLPKNVSSQARVIISTRPIGPWETLIQYPNTEIWELPKLSNEEIAEIISYYNEVHKLNLSKADQEILQKRAEGNPLYLKVALEEILSSGIAVGELATSVNSLFEQILQRLQKLYGETIIADYLGLICASRFGLTESELRELLQENSSDDLLLGVTKSLENFLIQRGGVILFFHSEFERTLKQRLGRKEIRSYHNQLSQYFLQKGFGYPRTLGEICYQQQWGEEFLKLLQTLSDWGFLDAKCRKGMIDDLAQDFFFALNSMEVPVPDTLEVLVGTEITVSKNTIALLDRALNLDLSFLRRNPDLLFQCLWNRCYWYDCPEMTNYCYGIECVVNSERLYLLAEKWRREAQHPAMWLKSIRPIEPHLDSPIHMVFPGHQKEVISVAYSPNNRYIATGGEDKILCIWNVETGECTQRIEEHQAYVHIVAFSQDSKKLLSVSHDRLIFIWDSQSGECLQIIDAPENLVTSGMFVDNEMIVIGLEDGSVCVYDIETGEKYYSCMHYGQPVVSLDVSKNRVIAIGYKDGHVALTDLQSRQKVGLWKAHSRIISSIALDENARVLITGAKDSLVKVWKCGTMKCLETLREHESNIIHIAIAKDGKSFISVDERKICVWNITQWDLQKSLAISGANNIATSNDDFSMLLCGSKDGTAALWNLQKATGYLPRIINHSAAITKCSVDTSRRYALTCSIDQNIRIWNLRNGICEKEFRGHNSPVLSAVFNEDTKRIVSADEKGYIKLWNVSTTELIRDFLGHRGIVSNVFFHSQGQKIISVGFFDNSLRIWDTASGQCLHTLVGHEKWIEDVAFSNNGLWVATASRDKTLRIWEITTGKCLRVLRGHEKSVTRVAFSYDNGKIASGSYNGAINVWDTERGACLIVLHEHQASITGLAFSEDGKHLVSHSRDHTTRIWDFSNGKCISVMEGIANLKDLIDDSCPIYSVMKNWQTVFVCKKTQQTLVSWADRLTTKIIDKDLVLGTSESHQQSLNIFTIQS